MQTTERHGVDRFFRNPETGKVAVVQLPNLPLVLFLVLRSIELVLSPEGWVADVLHWGGTAALTWWSVDEVARGSSPFRRVLGALVLAYVVVSTALALLG
jgi:hypothetical protein